MNRQRIVLCLSVAVLLTSVFSAASSEDPAQLAVVASSDWSIEEVALRDLRRIYLKQLERIGGIELQPVDARGTSANYGLFIDRVVGMSRPRFENYWLEQALSGGARPPRQMSPSRKRIEFVSRNVGALAYVPLAELRDLQERGVKVLLIDGREPGDPGYALK